MNFRFLSNRLFFNGQYNIYSNIPTETVLHDLLNI